jgi:beta-N-acetylhexosaminidase
MRDSPPRLRPVHIVIVAALVILIGLFLLLAYFLISGNDGGSQSANLAPTISSAALTATSNLLSERASPAPPSPTRPSSEPEPAPSITPTPKPTNPTPPITTTPEATLTFTATPSPTISQSTLPWYPVDEAEVEAILGRLTLEQKVGQMLMVGLPGPFLDDVTRQRIVDLGVGGVIFLERNTTSPEQVREFTQAMQSLAINQGPGLPLFIGWNQEGGSVIRRAAGLTQFPANMAVGLAGQPETAFDIGQATAEEMLSLGVNMNFAPVLDVNTEPANPVIGLRSYGDIPELVAAYGQNYIQGQQQAGVIDVAKHFPGHGGVDVDSHLALPTLNSSLESLMQRELPPFQAALDADVAAVMVAHIQIPSLDPSGRPASLSDEIINGLLRDRLGFDGVIMTDALGMKAITDQYSFEEGAIQAVLAGNDMLLSVETSDQPERIHQALLGAVQDGRISEAQIDDSVRRLIRLKLAAPINPGPAGPLLPNQEVHRTLAENLGREAVKLLQDESDWLPLTASSRIVLITPDKMNPGPTTGDQKSALGEKLAERGLNVTELFYNHESPEDIASIQSQALSLAPSADVYLVVTWDAILRYAHHQETAQENLVNALLTTGKPVVVVFGQLPYDAERLPDVPAQIAMYGDTAGQIEGVVSLLLDSG